MLKLMVCYYHNEPKVNLLVMHSWKIEKLLHGADSISIVMLIVMINSAKKIP